jgi:hypothetical protein
VSILLAGLPISPVCSRFFTPSIATFSQFTTFYSLGLQSRLHNGGNL